MAESLKPRQSAVRILGRVLEEGETVTAAILEEKDFWEKLGEQFLQGLTDVAVQGIGKMVDGGIDAMFANAQGRQARKAATEDMITSLQGLTDISQANDVQKAAIQSLGIDLSKAEPGQSFKDVAAAQLCKGSCSKEVVDMKDMNLTKRYDSDGVEHEMKLGETKTVVDDKALNKALKQQTRGKSNFVVGMNENGTYQTAASVHRTAASEAAGKSWGGHMNIGSTIPQNNDKDRAFKNEDDARKWAKDNGLSDDQTKALIDRQRF